MMGIILLLYTINFNYGFTLKSEYWLFTQDKREHLELNGNLELDLEQLIVGVNYNVTMDSTAKDFNLLRPFLTYDSNFLSITLGSFEKELLHGLALNLTRREDIKTYGRLWGINVEARYKKFSFSMLSGKPEILGFNGYRYNIENDTSDVVRFTDIKIDNIFNKIGVEAVYGRRNYKAMPSPYSFDELFGGVLNLSWNILDLTTSYIKYLGCDPVLYARKSGIGTYSSLNFYLNFLTLNARYAYYDSINFGSYNLPPTPTDKEILLSGGSGEKGFGVSISFFNKNFNAKFNHDNLKGLYSNKYYSEYILYIEYTNELLSIMGKAGREYEREVEPDVPEITRDFLEMQFSPDLHPLEDISVYFSRNNEKNISDYYYELNFSATLSYNDIYLIPGLNYITHSLPRYENENTWPRLILRLKRENYYIDLFYGKEKGGLNCSGGICRFEPPFEGFRISLNFSI